MKELINSYQKTSRPNAGTRAWFIIITRKRLKLVYNYLKKRKEKIVFRKYKRVEKLINNKRRALLKALTKRFRKETRRTFEHERKIRSYKLFTKLENLALEFFEKRLDEAARRSPTGIPKITGLELFDESDFL
jgi:lysyl-tRNA synthetase class I